MGVMQRLDFGQSVHYPEPAATRTYGAAMDIFTHTVPDDGLYVFNGDLNMDSDAPQSSCDDRVQVRYTLARRRNGADTDILVSNAYVYGHGNSFHLTGVLAADANDQVVVKAAVAVPTPASRNFTWDAANQRLQPITL